MKPPRRNPFRRFARSERGALAVTVALCTTMLVALMAFATDIGFIYMAQNQLQSATDAAALAGAQAINDDAGNSALAVAKAYGPETGQQNAGSFSATFVAGYPQLLCLKTIDVACKSPDNANAIRIKEQADVPTLFAKVFGVSTWHIEATSTASARGGSAGPLDVMIVLDTTASMNSTDAKCSMANASRLDCALNGVRTLLGSMPPCMQTFTSCSGKAPLVKVGLMVFPGLTNTNQVQYNYDCSASTKPQIAAYNASPVYQISALTTDYRTSPSGGLNTGSNLVIASRGGGSGCSAGMSAQGGVSTYFADVLAKAQAALDAQGRSEAQKVIIFLSDGDANAPSKYVPSGKDTDQCAQAVTQAKAATAAGTWVYSIAYGAASGSGTCSTDKTKKTTACETMKNIASDTTKFFSDVTSAGNACTSTANSITDLNSIFKAIVTDVTGVRLLSNDVT